MSRAPNSPNLPPRLRPKWDGRAETYPATPTGYPSLYAKEWAEFLAKQTPAPSPSIPMNDRDTIPEDVMNTATQTVAEMRESDLRLNRRYMRASQLTAVVMNLLSDHIENHDERDHRRDVYEKLMRLFSENGFDAVTDGDRERAGLPPRDPMGWTALEIAQYERATLEAMLTPTVVIRNPS